MRIESIFGTRIIDCELTSIWRVLKTIKATKDKRIQVVLSDEDWDKFRRYVFEKNISMSEELRDYIKKVTAVVKD